MSSKAARRTPGALYHFTSLRHWAAIQRDGFIRPTVPNLRRPTPEEMAGTLAGLPQVEEGSPLVVWLTDDPYPGAGSDHGLKEAKRAVRLTVDVMAEPWRSWAPRQSGAERDWLRVMNETGGGKGSRWFVHVGPIPLSAVTAVRVRKTTP